MLSNENQFRYDAFISYRHCDPDKRIAEKLHRMLETYKIPKAIVKASGKKRINRVFRDREELPPHRILLIVCTNLLSGLNCYFYTLYF